MGQKVHPTGIRLGISRDWNAKWYANKRDFPDYLEMDMQLRDYLRKRLANASISQITIERPARSANVTIHTARPGVVIGKKGEDIEALRRDVARRMGLDLSNVKINIEEIRKPEIDAQLVADSIAQQLARRVMFRRAMKRAVGNAMRTGALGIRVNVAGRLNGAEIARSEWYREGRVPLHTFRADIDYALAEAETPYGILGVKVWIFKGEVFDLEEKQREGAAQSRANASAGKGRGRGERAGPDKARA
jgi:small subunit ribosomal protein S3